MSTRTVEIRANPFGRDLAAPGESGIKARFRSMYVNGSAGDTVNAPLVSSVRALGRAAATAVRPTWISAHRCRGSARYWAGHRPYRTRGMNRSAAWHLPLLETRLVISDLLADRVVLITGASGGIAAAAAKVFSRQGGAVVVVAARREDRPAACGRLAVPAFRSRTTFSNRSNCFIRRLVNVSIHNGSALNTPAIQAR
jgi:hypothetical protein